MGFDLAQSLAAILARHVQIQDNQKRLVPLFLIFNTRAPQQKFHEFHSVSHTMKLFDKIGLLERSFREEIIVIVVFGN